MRSFCLLVLDIEVICRFHFELWENVMGFFHIFLRFYGLNKQSIQFLFIDGLILNENKPHSFSQFYAVIFIQ